MSVLTLVDKPLMEQIASIEQGLRDTALDQIVRMLGLPKPLVIASLRLAPRKAKERFSLGESERLVRVLRIHRLVREVFTTNEAAAQWLNTPDRNFKMDTPLRMLVTDIGAAKVENQIRAMMHGIPF